MENAESGEAPEIPDIDRQYLPDAMDIHGRCRPGVMDLHAQNVMRDQQGPPAIVDFPAVRQKLEISFATLKPNPFLSSGRVEAFQNSPSVCEV